MSEADILRELRRISKILLLANSQILERELGKLATTDERKKIWMAIDGRKTTADIASVVGVTQRSVQRFLKDAKLAELIDYQNDSVRRLIDYVPPSWLQLLPSIDREQQPSTPILASEPNLDQLGASEAETS